MAGQGMAAGAQCRVIQAREEQLHVHKQPVTTGEVAIRKDVHTEQKTVQVPVKKEEIVIERRAVSGQQAAGGGEFKAGEQIRMAEVTFNRDVLPASVGANAPSVFIERDTGQTPRPRLAVDLQLSANIVRIVLRDPATFTAGKYILNCLGTSPAGAVLPIVKAADDQSSLDGDYDNEAGGNLVLPFTAL